MSGALAASPGTLEPPEHDVCGWPDSDQAAKDAAREAGRRDFARLIAERKVRVNALSDDDRVAEFRAAVRQERWRSEFLGGCLGMWPIEAVADRFEAAAKGAASWLGIPTDAARLATGEAWQEYLDEAAGTESHMRDAVGWAVRAGASVAAIDYAAARVDSDANTRLRPEYDRATLVWLFGPTYADHAWETWNAMVLRLCQAASHRRHARGRR